MNEMIRTGKALLDALAFANVNNLGEFRAMLREVEPPAETASKPNSDDTLPPPAPLAVLPPLQGAL